MKSENARAIFEAYLRAEILGTPLERHEKLLYETAVAHINIYLEPTSTKNMKHGVSRIAGFPDLPIDFKWPFHQGEPLVFIAQFNLEEVAPYDTFEQLPKTGMLSFFHFDLGEVYEDSSAWQVCIHPLQGLVRHTPPYQSSQNEISYRTSFETVYDFKYSELLIELVEEEFLKVVNHFGDNEPTHLLGQSSNNLSCDREGILLEISKGDLSYLKDKYFETAIFGIDSSDLRERRFDRVWTEVTRD